MAVGPASRNDRRNAERRCDGRARAVLGRWITFSAARAAPEHGLCEDVERAVN